MVNIMNKKATCICDVKAMLGEGPVWVARDNSLYWIDILNNKLYCYNLHNQQQSCWDLSEQLTSFAPRQKGGFIGTSRHGFAFFGIDVDSNYITLQNIVMPESEPKNNCFNDGKIDAQGRYWAGSMDDQQILPSGNLYLLNSELQCRVKDSGYIITNGPTFNRDQTILYHTNSLEKVIYAFDLNINGELANKREFIRLNDDAGIPDGMTIDSEDCLWVCQFNGWCITRYSSAGVLIGRIDLPVANITSCTFGGSELEQMFITTARTFLTEEELIKQPQAGGLFTCKPGVIGLASPDFAG